MDENQFNDLVDLTLTKVKETVKNIRNGEYRIKPKRFNGNETKCTNCPFGDLCFKSPNDYEEIKIEKEKKEGEESGD
jgi:ATP-dependent helicase/DNAse subunit B